MSGNVSIFERSRQLPLARYLTEAGPLRLGYAEAALNNLATSITTPLVVPFAVSLGASGWEVGLITALPLLGMNLSQVPAAALSARFRGPGGYLLVSGGLGRLAWLALALLLLVGGAGYPALLAAATLGSISSGLQTPMWTAFLGERVPEDRRGNYFGTRNLWAGTFGLGGAFIGVWLASAAGFHRGNGLAVLLAVVAASGAVGAQVAAVGRARHRVALPSAVLSGRDPRVWRSPAIRDYIIYGALLILGAGMATPYYSVQFINTLRGAPQTATAAIAVANAISILGQGLWGRIVDRHGIRVVGAVSLAGIVLVPLLWVVARDPFQGVPIWLLNGFLWAACGIATFNLMLAISDDSNRASVVAWVNTLQAPVNFAAPMIGGFVAERAGLPVLFAASSATLGISWLYFLRSFRNLKRAE